MTLPQSLRTSRRPISRRLIQLASLGLAGLLAGLLTGCNGDAAYLFSRHIDTDWQTSGTYASATAALPPNSASHTARSRPCGACDPHPTLVGLRPVHRIAK